MGWMLQSKDIGWLNGWKRQDPPICCLQETLFISKDTERLKVRAWKKIVHASRNEQKVGVTILISDKVDFNVKSIIKDKEGHYIIIKGSL